MHVNMWVRVVSAATFTAAFVLLTVANKAAFASPCGSTVVLTISSLQQLFVVMLVMAQDRCSDYMGHVVFSWSDFKRVLPVGILSALDVGLSNVALQLLPLSMFQIVKCLTPAFVLVLGFIFGTGKPSWILGLSIVLIVGGSIQSVLSSVEDSPPTATNHPAQSVAQPFAFSISGLLVLVVAIGASSLRTIVSQLLVQKSVVSNLPPISAASATFHSALQMLVVMTVAAALTEGDAVLNFHNCEPLPMEMYWIVLTVLFAYLVSVMTFWLTLVTSALTTSVCALLQRLATVLLAVVVLHETVRSATWIGFFISLGGIVLYNFEHRITRLFCGEEANAEGDAELEPIAAASANTNAPSLSYGTVSACK